jgi:hypothetical protein
MTYYPPERSRSIVSDVELVYTLACPQGHTWTSDAADLNANAFGDFDGETAECPTCGAWFSEIDVKQESI